MWWEFLACQWKPFSKAAIIRTKRRTFLQVSKGFLKFWERWKLATSRSRNFFFFFQKNRLFVKNHSTTFIRLHPDTVFYTQSSVFRNHPDRKIRKWEWKRHRNKTKQNKTNNQKKRKHNKNIREKEENEGEGILPNREEDEDRWLRERWRRERGKGSSGYFTNCPPLFFYSAAFFYRPFLPFLACPNALLCPI